MTTGSIVAAGHPLTAEGALHAFKCGGNAFDAALAGWFVACLAEPVLTSPGGGGFAMVSPASGRPRLYDFFTQTPLSRNPEAKDFPVEADFGSTRQVFHLGAGTVATPGCVAGLLQMHGDFGRLPISECAAPARDLCRNGLPITGPAARLLEVVSALYTSTPEAQALFGSPANPEICLTEGEIFHNPIFEAFLDMIIAEGARWFYAGDVSRLVEEYARAHGGHLRREDFGRYAVHVREPLEIKRNGATVWLNPPPAMGGTLIAMGLSLREPQQENPYPFRRDEDWLPWIEPLRLMSLLRNAEDPELLKGEDKELIQEAIMRSPGLESAVQQLFPHAIPQVREKGTTQLSIMDDEGNEISMTTSNGSGSAIMVPGTGFMLNNMLGEEDLQPQGKDTWTPDTRLSSMMAPTLARLPEGMIIATGSGGSNRIRSTLLQVLRHLVDRGTRLEEAIEAPRLHWENHELHGETDAVPYLRNVSTDNQWQLVEHMVPNLFFGGAHTVVRQANGALSGFGDPRRGGVCRGA